MAKEDVVGALAAAVDVAVAVVAVEVVEDVVP